MNEFERELVKVITQHEGDFPWLYCVPSGFVAVGVGHITKGPDDAAILPLFRPSGDEASIAQKRLAWGIVQGRFSRGKVPGFYKPLTELRLVEGAGQSLLISHLRGSVLPFLEHRFRQFGRWPMPAALALTDMLFDLGADRLLSFDKLLTACQAEDWFSASREEVGTAGGGYGVRFRAQWRASQFLKAARLAR